MLLTCRTSDSVRDCMMQLMEIRVVFLCLFCAVCAVMAAPRMGLLCLLDWRCRGASFYETRVRNRAGAREKTATKRCQRLLLIVVHPSACCCWHPGSHHSITVLWWAAYRCVQKLLAYRLACWGCVLWLPLLACARFHLCWVRLISAVLTSTTRPQEALRLSRQCGSNKHH